MNTNPWLLPVIKQINTTARNTLKNNLRRYEITDVQLEVLMYLNHNKEKTINQRQIESELKLSNPTIVSLLDRLEEKELVKRSVSSIDRRQKNLKITELGERMCESLHEDFCNVEASLKCDLSKDEEEKLKELLERVLSNLLK